MTHSTGSALHPSVPAPIPAECLLTESDAQLLFGGARTAYTFTDEPVTGEELRAIHELAKWAPTAVNAQPLRVVAVCSEEARARLLPCLPRGNREQSAGAPLTLVCAADRGFTETLERVHPRGARYRALLAEGGADRNDAVRDVALGQREAACQRTGQRRMI